MHHMFAIKVIRTDLHHFLFSYFFFFFFFSLHLLTSFIIYFAFAMSCLLFNVHKFVVYLIFPHKKRNTKQKKTIYRKNNSKWCIRHRHLTLSVSYIVVFDLLSLNFYFMELTHTHTQIWHQAKYFYRTIKWKFYQ